MHILVSKHPREQYSMQVKGFCFYSTLFCIWFSVYYTSQISKIVDNCALWLLLRHICLRAFVILYSHCVLYIGFRRFMIIRVVVKKYAFMVCKYAYLHSCMLRILLFVVVYYGIWRFVNLTFDIHKYKCANHI